ncbi:hypothetical protein PU630_01110 [Microbacterium horticulturae]|uniref:O-antigen ligase n=1 Tax=Microbacterium horticulturae TaxID=3028316 RepID=A0ABY8BZ88_9MICO|nr:hypothetical protein [Microbacterium sp. KACC 23027]WEG09192.1 hypothetical protein PU630_01110 [Microbacterium sp. KACC 23027]
MSVWGTPWGRRRLPVECGTVILVLTVTGAVMGILSATLGDVAFLIALAVVCAALALVDPPLVAVVALPATVLQSRVGGLLSVADLVLALAAAVVLILVRPQGLRSMQSLLWAGTFYLACSLPSVVLNPFSSNIIEWFHEVALVLGSMIVGFAVGRTGRASLAARLYLLACLVIAAWASAVGLIYIAQGALQPVGLPDLNKNTIGGMLGFAIVMVYARPTWLRLPSWMTWGTILLCGAGISAAQSRQAMVGAIAGVFIVSLRRRPETGRFPKIVWFAAVPVLFIVLTMVNDQLDSGNQFNSSYQRLSWYAETIRIWLTSSVFGVGQRWWYTGQFGEAFQPPNAELEVLSTFGVVGLGGFLVMFAVAIWATWRINPVYGTVGTAIIATRFVQAQFDLYWVAGQASLLWIIAGICYGVLERDRAQGTEIVLPGRDSRHRQRRILPRPVPPRSV